MFVVLRQLLRPSLPGVVPSCSYAARKGTRERKEKLKKARKAKKVEVKKLTFQELLQQKKLLKQGEYVSLRMKDDHLPKAVDDTYAISMFKRKIYPFAEALECHRVTHSPDMYNVPDALLYAYVEMDMTAAKKTRFLDAFYKTYEVPAVFPCDQPRTVMAFVKTEALQQAAEDAGADLVGAGELVKRILAGELPTDDYQFVVAHPNIIADVSGLRGILKKKFPSARNGNLGQDIGMLVKKYKNSMEYKANTTDREKDYGWVDLPIGRLNMEAADIEANIEALVKDIESKRPKRDGPFVTRCYLSSSITNEKFIIDHVPYLSEDVEGDSDDSDSDEEETASTAA